MEYLYIVNTEGGHIRLRLTPFHESYDMPLSESINYKLNNHETKGNSDPKFHKPCLLFEKVRRRLMVIFRYRGPKGQTSFGTTKPVKVKEESTADVPCIVHLKKELDNKYSY